MLKLTAVLPALIAFAVTAVLGPWIIPLLHRLKFGQPEIKVGLTEHLKKNGTPTMGGIIFLLGIGIASVFFAGNHPKIVPVLFLMLGFGIVGFIDDYVKVTKKGSDGIRAWQKLGLQILVFVVYVILLQRVGDVTLLIRLPFTGGQMVDIGIFTYPLMFFALLGTTNGTNLTDGVDGLLTSVTAVVAVFFLAASLFLGGDVEPLASAVLGGLCGFLLF
ncbi:MAG: phospho-N-acetylmuramoyl-pentapeptide-transferase, partial [bacterium]